MSSSHRGRFAQSGIGFAGLGEDDTKTGGEVVLIDDLDGLPLGGGRSHWNGVAQLSETASEPVDPGNACGLPLLTHPVELLGEELFELLTRQSVVGIGLTLGPGKSDLKDLLCEIDGDEITLAHGLLLSWDIQRFTPECWHIAMPVKTREESISSLKFVPPQVIGFTLLAKEIL